MSEGESRLEIALKYAARGIRVFPVKPTTKKPYLKGGFHVSSTDPEVIQKWFTKYKSALVGAPNDQFTVIDVDYDDGHYAVHVATNYALKLLFDRIGIQKGMLTVTTPSNGKHFYFKKDESLTRQIKILPNIDLLADGGYTVLPDQMNYIADAKIPWGRFDKFPVLDTDLLFELAAELEPLTEQCKFFRKILNKGITLDSQPSKTEFTANVDTGECDAPVGDVDGSPLYARSDMNIDISDPYAKILINGKLEISQGELESVYVTKLFHNREIQSELAKFMGIVPDLKSFKSLFPDHEDASPSMSARWSKTGDHIIVCDWSKHYGNANSKNTSYTAYNLVQLYTMIKYNSDRTRLSKQEFVIWFIRMMHDAKIIDLTPYIKKYALSTDDLSKAELRVAEGIALLDAVKSRYQHYDGTMTFSVKFGSAWNGRGSADTYTGKLKKKLIEKGYLKDEGFFDCSKGKRTDGFMNTPIISMITDKTLEKDSNV